jgi:hypothetical protein
MAGRRGRTWMRRDESQWRALLSRFSGSGLSAAALCERESNRKSQFLRLYLATRNRNRANSAFLRIWHAVWCRRLSVPSPR